MSLSGKALIVTGAGSGIGRAVAVAAAADGARVALLGRRKSALQDTAAQVRDALVPLRRRRESAPEDEAAHVRDALVALRRRRESAHEDTATQAQDARVALRGRRKSATEDTAAQAREALVVPTDLSEPAAVDAAVGTVLEEFGRLDGLVNNAGTARFAPVDQADPKDLQVMFDVHVRGPVQLIQRCLPALRASRGAIVNVTSVGGALATPNRSFYGATKAAINHLTRSLAAELAPDVRVNAVLPGPVDTPIYDDLGLSGEATQRLRENLIAATPLRRFGTPDEVARWVCMLLGDAGAWVTGVLLPVDGGRCA